MKTPTQTAASPALDRRPRYTIGGAATNSGVSARMIRHYESVGLMPRAGRSPGNYRTYSDADVHTLRFIHRARELGFSMKQIVTLVSLWRNRSRPSATVRELAAAHIANLREKIDALQSMANTLEDLARHCHGDSRPECPILDDLAAPAVRGMRTGRSRS
jgi:MerR family transcriptional regulator, copper efflux regulator